MREKINPNKSENKWITSVKMAIELEIKAPMASIMIKMRTIPIIVNNLNLTPYWTSLIILGLYQISSSSDSYFNWS